MKKKVSAVKRVIRGGSESVATNPDTSKVDAFREYLKIENPDWFKIISYSANTVIDYYRKRHLRDEPLTKPEYKEFLKALDECDSNFK